MTEKLTMQEIITVMGKHINSPVVGSISRKQVSKLGIIDEESIRLFLNQEAKLLLKPLAQMKEEDAVDLAKIVMIYPNMLPEEDKIWNDEVICDAPEGEVDGIIVKVSVRCFEGEVKLFYDGKISVRDEDGKELPNMESGIPHQFLISKGYDVPLFFALDHWANGKTAIQLNLAFKTN